MTKTVAALVDKIRTLDEIICRIDAEQPVDLCDISELLEEYRFYLGSIKVEI
jgi:hypothetical protein